MPKMTRFAGRVQALFGVRVFADIVGRLLPIRPLLASQRRLVAASIAKVGAALLFLAHIALGRAQPRHASGQA